MTGAGVMRTPLLSRRKVLVGLGMLAAGSVAQARMPQPDSPRVPKETLEKMIPNTIGNWTFAAASGLVLPPPDSLSDRLYDSIVTRVYTNPVGQTLMMLIAYNNRQDGVLQIHRPEVCYPAGGFVLSETQPVDVGLGGAAPLPCQAFSARSVERDEVVLYWTRVGDTFPRRWLDQRLAVARANLDRVIPDGLLVRVSTLGGDLPVELPVLERFIADMAQKSSRPLGQLLFGGLRPPAGA
ncbi:MAG: EpsI family protein [Sphingomonadales bacterium 32-68-7]|nr:MAG: EpsI family protein [Sphingomonadales bacterium 12-68-11]OYX10573.1 MAG: EpsI family protein [Sphingomonadales bacterium 32-68-7]